MVYLGFSLILAHNKRVTLVNQPFTYRLLPLLVECRRLFFFCKFFHWCFAERARRWERKMINDEKQKKIKSNQKEQESSISGAELLRNAGTSDRAAATVSFDVGTLDDACPSFVFCFFFISYFFLVFFCVVLLRPRGLSLLSVNKYLGTCDR